MAKLVYKGKINGNNVIYKEDCFNYHLEGGFRQNIMEVVTETGKRFRFITCNIPYFVLDCLKENKTCIYDDSINYVVIKEEGKNTLKYNSKHSENHTLKGKRTRLVIEKANEMYNGIRREILKELREKPKDKKLETLIMTEEKESHIKEEVEDVFNTNPIISGLRLYKDNSKRFIEYFSKIEDKNRKKDLLNLIFSCDYENKEVIEWFNKNEQDLIREVGFDG